MTNIMDLEEHIGFSEWPKTEKICRVLFRQSPIQYFCYQRLYRNGLYTFLPSRTELGRYFFSNGLSSETWLSMPFENFRSGLLLWNVALDFSTPKQKEIQEFLNTELKLNYGMDIIEKFDDFCDIYCFASNDINLYRYPVHRLKNFMFYFRQQYHRNIVYAQHEKFRVRDEPLNMQSVPILETNISANVDGNNLFEIKKFYLHRNNRLVYLTKKEVYYLNQFAEGYSAKEVARISGASHRTIQHNVERMKSKLECKRLVELIKIAMKNNII